MHSKILKTVAPKTKQGLGNLTGNPKDKTDKEISNDCKSLEICEGCQFNEQFQSLSFNQKHGIYLPLFNKKEGLFKLPLVDGHLVIETHVMVLIQSSGLWE